MEKIEKGGDSSPASQARNDKIKEFGKTEKNARENRKKLGRTKERLGMRKKGRDNKEKNKQ